MRILKGDRESGEQLYLDTSSMVDTFKYNNPEYWAQIYRNSIMYSKSFGFIPATKSEFVH